MVSNLLVQMKKKKIVYLGNQLLQKGLNPTSIDTLGSKLEELFDVEKASSRNSFFSRIIDMWQTVFKNRKDCQVVLIDTYSTLAFHFAWTSGYLCKLLGIPYIPILHGGNLGDRMKQSPYLFQRYLKNAFQVVSPSYFLKEALENPSQVSIQVIPNLLEIEKYPFSVPVNQGNLVLIWLRAFADIYRPENAIKVVDFLKKRGHEDVQLFMIGPDKDGTMEPCQKLVKKLGLERNVQFMGRMKREDWIPIARKGNIFINTTSVDNMPVSLLEMMALGIPIVSTSVGGIPYVIKDGENGMLVKVDDIESMGNTILNLWNDPRKQYSISIKGRQTAESCAWSHVKESWGELIAQLENDSN